MPPLPLRPDLCKAHQPRQAYPHGHYLINAGMACVAMAVSGCDFSGDSDAAPTPLINPATRLILDRGGAHRQRNPAVTHFFNRLFCVDNLDKKPAMSRGEVSNEAGHSQNSG